MSILGSTTVNCNSILPIGGVPSGAIGGGIIQCVQTIKTDTYVHSSNAGFTDVTGLSATITPRSTSSKILVSVNLNHSGFSYLAIRLYRDANLIYVGDASGSRIQAWVGPYHGYDNRYGTHTSQALFVDSPATTSATTYKVNVGTPSGTNRAVMIGRSYDDTDSNEHTRTPSSIILMEVSG